MWKDLILWKESLNSDYQQFHQYQQNEQSLLPSLIEHIKGGPRHVTVIYESLPNFYQHTNFCISIYQKKYLSTYSTWWYLTVY